MKKIILSIMLTFIMGACNMNNSEKQTEIWDKTFKQSDNVSVEKVYFKNRYGFTLAGDLYIPKNIDKSKKYPAVAVSGPFGAVKEQASGLYVGLLLWLLMLHILGKAQESQEIQLHLILIQKILVPQWTF